MSTSIFDRDAVWDNFINTNLPANKTYPKGATWGEIITPAGSERHSVPQLVLGAWQAGLAVMLLGDPGNGKTALLKALATAVEADFIWFGPNADPSSSVVPGVGRRVNEAGDTVEFIDYIMEGTLRSDVPKVILFDELNRMNELMRQQALEVILPPHRIAGNPIQNVVGIAATGNHASAAGVTGMLDPALSTRMIHIPVKASAMPWKYFVAAEFADVNLTDAFKVHDKLHPHVREQVTPRKFRKIVWNLLHNGCAWPALAMIDSEYETIADLDGNDVRGQLFADLAAALGTPNRDVLPDKAHALIKAVVEHGQVVYMEGAPGVGKTSWVESIIHELRPDAKVYTVSMANASPENWQLPMIVGDELVRTLLEFFQEDGEKYLIADEVWRCDDATMNMLLEVFQERTIAGRPTGLRGIVALNNPREVEGYQLDVGTPDVAQADRFSMSVTVTAADIPWETFILTKYGDTAEHFVEWWKGISTRDQLLYPPRVLEMAIRWYNTGLPLEYTKPWYDGEPLDISLHELERALADRPMVKIKDVVNRVDHFATAIAAENGQFSEEHRSVFDAFDRADIVQLREAREAIETLFPLLSQQSRINLLRSAKEKRKFWMSVISGTPEK